MPIKRADKSSSVSMCVEPEWVGGQNEYEKVYFHRYTPIYSQLRRETGFVLFRLCLNDGDASLFFFKSLEVQS